MVRVEVLGCVDVVAAERRHGLPLQHLYVRWQRILLALCSHKSFTQPSILPLSYSYPMHAHKWSKIVQSPSLVPLTTFYPMPACMHRTEPA